MVMDQKKELDDLSAQIKKCRECGLYKTANNAVAGEGSEKAEIMFIGEGPGFNEDREGRPFVGLAGQLLNKLLTSINLKREEVFIANIVKHRPVENRDPLPQEINACNKWLDKQIEIINPKIVVTLGRFSMMKFIPGVTISRVHGQPRLVQGRLIIPMFHPAAALRDSRVLEMTKTDFQIITKYRSGNYTAVIETETKQQITTSNVEKKRQDEQLSLI